MDSTVVEAHSRSFEGDLFCSVPPMGAARLRDACGQPDRKNFFYDRAERSRIQNVCTRRRRTLTSRLLPRHSLCHGKAQEESVEGVHTQHGVAQVRRGEEGGGGLRIQAEVFGSHGRQLSIHNSSKSGHPATATTMDVYEDREEEEKNSKDRKQRKNKKSSQTKEI